MEKRKIQNMAIDGLTYCRYGFDFPHMHGSKLVLQVPHAWREKKMKRTQDLYKIQTCTPRSTLSISLIYNMIMGISKYASTYTYVGTDNDESNMRAYLPFLSQTNVVAHFLVRYMYTIVTLQFRNIQLQLFYLIFH